MRKYTLLLLLLLSMSLLTVNCTKEHDGNWHGTTSTGKSISFWVDANKVQNFSIEPMTCSIYPVDGAGISGKKFSIGDNGISISGKFNTETEASGTFNISNRCNFSGSGTWTATK